MMSTKNQNRMLLAADDPASLMQLDCTVDLVAASADAPEDEKKAPKISIIAYNGGLMDTMLFGPTVVESSGVSLPKKHPILKDHDRSIDGVVGPGVTTLDGVRLVTAGTLSLANEAAQRILQLSRDGVELQASVGIKPVKWEFIDSGKSVTANGKTFTAGPMGLTYVSKGQLKEVSIVAIGADDRSSTRIAASAPRQEIDMNFQQWMEAQGFDPKTLTAPQIKALEAAYAAAQKTDKHSPPEMSAAEKQAVVQVERDRVASIEACFVGFEMTDEIKGIRDEGLKGSATVEQVQSKLLGVLRAARPASRPSVGPKGGNITGKVLEAAVMLGSATPTATVEKMYDAAALEAAYHYRRIGLRDLVTLCCRMGDVAVPEIGADVNELVTAGFSTSQLTTLLSNVAHKTAMAQYTMMPSVAAVVCRKLSAADFKVHTGVKLTGDATLKQLNDKGEIEHGTFGNDSFTYQIYTYARQFGISRQMMYDDDTQGFLAIPTRLGRGAYLARERAWATLLLANTGTFFGSGHRNYISGATTTISVTGLSLAVKAFSSQVDGDGDPILVLPKFMVCSPAGKAAADTLYVSTKIKGTTNEPDGNIHAGKYQPLECPYISATGFHANVDDYQWYLFGDPMDVAAFGIAYLNGQETPTIEQAPMSADYLGQTWRGFLDFGVCQIDYRGAVKSKGQA